MKAQHTPDGTTDNPFPWQTRHNLNGGMLWDYMQNNLKHKVSIALINKANKKYIVRACTNFDDLLAACKTAAEDCRMALSGEWDKSDSGFKDTMEMLQAAIDKAQG